MHERVFDPAFTRAVTHFNALAFFEAHEEWEDLWQRLPECDARRFVQGMIQIAAGFYKLLSVKQPASAARLLSRGVVKLREHANGNPGIDAEELSDAIVRCVRALGDDPPEHAAANASFDLRLLPRVRCIS